MYDDYTVHLYSILHIIKRLHDSFENSLEMFHIMGGDTHTLCMAGHVDYILNYFTLPSPLPLAFCCTSKCYSVPFIFIFISTSLLPHSSTTFEGDQWFRSVWFCSLIPSTHTINHPPARRPVGRHAAAFEVRDMYVRRDRSKLPGSSEGGIHRSGCCVCEGKELYVLAS